MGLKITNPMVFGDNGTFLKLRSDSDTDYQIDVDNLYMEGKGMTAFDISTLTPNQEFFTAFLQWLPETDRKEYINLIAQLQNKNQEEGMKIVKKSTMLEKLGGAANIIGITTNLLALAANPSVQQIITRFI